MTTYSGVMQETRPMVGVVKNRAKPGALVAGSVSGGTTVAPYQILNRGRNTGAGDAYVYWLSPTSYDPTGAYYPAGKPAWADITDVIGVGTVKTVV